MLSNNNIRKTVRKPSLANTDKPELATTIPPPGPKVPVGKPQRKSTSVHPINPPSIVITAPKKSHNNFVTPKQSLHVQSVQQNSLKSTSSEAPDNKIKEIPNLRSGFQGGRLPNQIKPPVEKETNDKAAIYEQIHKIPLYLTFSESSNKIEGESLSIFQQKEAMFSKTQYKGLDRWKILSTVGAGATSEVCKVYDKKHDRIVAGKRIWMLGDDPALEKAVHNEVRILSQIQHPNIVKYYETYKQGEDVWIFMEFLPTTVYNLYSESDEGHLSETATRVYTKQLVQAVKFLHEKKIIHKDIKCSNLLLSHLDILKLSDFGTSRQFQQSTSAGANLLNGPGTFKGSILWMAPETFSKDTYTRKSDVWSIGCTVLQMVTGLKPWHHLQIDNQFAAIVQISTRTTEIPLIPETLSQPLRDFLLMCLVRDPQKRASAEDLLKSKFLQS